MAKKNFSEQIADFQAKVDSLRHRGYAPVASFSNTENFVKVSNSLRETETRFEDGIKMGKDIGFSRYRTPVMVEGCGKEGLGYIRYGADNLLPVLIEKLADALPYTAQGLEYITNLLAGNGLAMMYNYVKIVNGEAKTVSIPYETAGTLLAYRINELREKIRVKNENENKNERRKRKDEDENKNEYENENENGNERLMPFTARGLDSYEVTLNSNGKGVPNSARDNEPNADASGTGCKERGNAQDYTNNANVADRYHDVHGMQYRVKPTPMEDPALKYANNNYDSVGTDEDMLEKAIEDYRKWEETMDWIKEFRQNSGNLDDIIQQWASDNVMYNLSFIRLQMEQGVSGAWGEVENGPVKKLTRRPRVVGVQYQPTQCSRFEQMDDNLHINNIYYAERWRFEGTIKDQAKAIVSFPCIEPQSRWRDLTNIVLANQTTKPYSRPSVVAPAYVGKTKSPYYPINGWWSIFPSMIYNLAVTLMTDSANARKNSTMWSKIIYLDVEWFEKYATQQKCETDEERDLLRQNTIEEIKKFLTDRNNNGKTVVGDKLPSPDGNKSIYSFEVVDVPQPTSKASLEDLEKVTSCIFFALGIHPALVGAVPGVQGKSSSGTQQRELTLLKQLQLSPKQRQILSIFEFIRDWNNLDCHLGFAIKKYVLSTLDRSNTGLVEDTE